ncbi:MAG: helix-turn-helix domain-containing protein [Chitinivibrionales bacterium]|nr:helix-turn-helix domain-containing protein [Chitinivibrionales bacterium]
MNKKYVGVSFEESVREWEKKDPELRAKINEYKEKAELAMLLKKTRTKEDISQTELAKKANVPQSVIARIESLESKSLPRLDLYSRIMSSIGYKLVINAVKSKIALSMPRLPLKKKGSGNLAFAGKNR